MLLYFQLQCVDVSHGQGKEKKGRRLTVLKCGAGDEYKKFHGLQEEQTNQCLKKLDHHVHKKHDL